MKDILCVAMGLLDFIAGLVILFSFNFNTFSVILGMAMILKGGFSFI